MRDELDFFADDETERSEANKPKRVKGDSPLRSLFRAPAVQVAQDADIEDDSPDEPVEEEYSGDTDEAPQGDIEEHDAEVEVDDAPVGSALVHDDIAPAAPVVIPVEDGDAPTRIRRTVILIALAVTVVAASVFALWFAFTRIDPPLTPVETVDRLLQARARATTDVSAYQGLLVDPQQAELLAQDSMQWVDAETEPIPQWEKPKLLEEGETLAKVEVVWKQSSEHPGWSKATVFTLELTDQVWKIADAAESTSTPGAQGMGK